MMQTVFINKKNTLRIYKLKKIVAMNTKKR